MQIHKNYFKSPFLVKIINEESVKSKKNIANPKKLIGSPNNFLKNSKIVLQSTNRCEIQKNIFKTGKYVLSRAAYASSQPALDVFPLSSD